MPQTSLTRAGVVTRLTVSALALLLLLYGTFFGSDADFPFGPFKMYAHRNAPDGYVKSLRLEAVTAHDEVIEIDSEAVGLRRADLEGSLPRMQHEPELMVEIVERYAENNPDEPELIELRVVVRVYQLEDGVQTGEFADEIQAVWTQQ